MTLINPFFLTALNKFTFHQITKHAQAGFLISLEGGYSEFEGLKLDYVIDAH